VLPSGKENLKGRLSFAFYAKERTGTGKGGVPAYLKMLAFKAVGGLCGEVLLAGGFVTHNLI
jgi:hypothetical protein